MVENLKDNVNAMLLINLYISSPTPTPILDIIDEKGIEIDRDFVFYIMDQKEEVEIHNKLKEIFMDFEIVDEELYNKIFNV